MTHHTLFSPKLKPICFLNRKIDNRCCFDTTLITEIKIACRVSFSCISVNIKNAFSMVQRTEINKEAMGLIAVSHKLGWKTYVYNLLYTAMVHTLQHLPIAQFHINPHIYLNLRKREEIFLITGITYYYLFWYTTFRENLIYNFSRNFNSCTSSAYVTNYAFYRFIYILFCSKKKQLIFISISKCDNDDSTDYDCYNK